MRMTRSARGLHRSMDEPVRRECHLLQFDATCPARRTRPPAKLTAHTQPSRRAHHAVVCHNTILCPLPRLLPPPAASSSSNLELVSGAGVGALIRQSHPSPRLNSRRDRGGNLRKRSPLLHLSTTIDHLPAVVPCAEIPVLRRAGLPRLASRRNRGAHEAGTCRPLQLPPVRSKPCRHKLGNCGTVPVDVFHGCHGNRCSGGAGGATPHTNL